MNVRGLRSQVACIFVALQGRLLKGYLERNHFGRLFKTSGVKGMRRKSISFHILAEVVVLRVYRVSVNSSERRQRTEHVHKSVKLLRVGINNLTRLRFPWEWRSYWQKNSRLSRHEARPRLEVERSLSRHLRDYTLVKIGKRWCGCGILHGIRIVSQADLRFGPVLLIYRGNVTEQCRAFRRGTISRK